MRVIITGGSGRLGSYVIRELISKGHEVSSIDTAEPAEQVCPSFKLDLKNIAELFVHLAKVDGLIHIARQRFPYTETGYDSVNQCWKLSDVAGDGVRFNDNLAMTYNVLTAAVKVGIKKIVSGSSLAIYGFYYPTRQTFPELLPVTEDHPCRPQDPYGLSKLVGEQLCEAFCRRNEVQIASLRFSGIYTDAHRPLLLERKNNPMIRGTGALWSYIDARDAATACRLALEADFAGYEAFNVCAPTTVMDTPTDELVQRYLPQVKTVGDDLKGNWSGYDTKKAAAMLGFQARHLFVNGNFT